MLSDDELVIKEALKKHSIHVEKIFNENKWIIILSYIGH
jgi:hypothetical protein